MVDLLIVLGIFMLVIIFCPLTSILILTLVSTAWWVWTIFGISVVLTLVMINEFKKLDLNGLLEHDNVMHID